MKFSKIKTILAEGPEFRLKQIKKLIFQDLIEDWNQASVLSLELRKKLSKEVPLEIIHKLFESNDKNTLKAVVFLIDGLTSETVLMRHRARNTVCISSQVGCALNCAFCATGKAGFERNLTSDEIVDQVLLFTRLLKKENKKLNNVVFMGMGEPFLNYEAVLEAIKTINDPFGLAIGSRHISVSTAGIIEGIKKFSLEPLQVNLAISLHAPTDKQRTQLMPVNRKYPLKDVLKIATDYVNKTKRKLMFEYTLIKGINDRPEDALNLAKIMDQKLFFVNLIVYNPTGAFESSSKESIEAFRKILEQKGVQQTLRYHFGSDINAACGQLAPKYYS